MSVNNRMLNVAVLYGKIANIEHKTWGGDKLLYQVELHLNCDERQALKVTYFPNPKSQVDINKLRDSVVMIYASIKVFNNRIDCSMIDLCVCSKQNFDISQE